MKFILVFVALTPLFAWCQKSVEYRGEQIMLYPYEKDIHLKSPNYDWNGNPELKKEHYNEFRFTTDNQESYEVFFPFGSIADGKYLCLTTEISAYSWEIYQKNKKAFKTLQTIDQKVPYAIIHVKNGELNGYCYYLSPAGDTTSYGNYKNNLKDGLWYENPMKTDYANYKEGKLHGESYSVFQSSHKSKKRQYTKTSTKRYAHGQLLEFESIKEYLTSSYTERKTFIDSTDGIKQLYEKKYKDQLIETGLFVDGERIGEHKWYYNNGQLKAKANFTGDTTELGNDFLKWANGIASRKDKPTLDLYGLKQQYRYDYNSNWLTVSRVFKGNTRTAYALADQVTFYHSNGKKQFSYEVKAGKFMADTLRHLNGNPEYFVYADNRAKDYVKQFYDENGVLENVERTPQFKVRSKTKKYVVFNGEKLKYEDKTTMGSCYHFMSYPDLDSLDPEKDTLIYTEYFHSGTSLIGQVYYLPFEHTRVEKLDVSDRYPYIAGKVWQETRQYFNDDYTFCKTEVILEIGRNIKMYQSFDQEFSSNYYERQDDIFEFDGLVRKQRGTHGIRGNSSNFFAATSFDYFVDDFHHPDIKISNYTSSINYKNKPYNGKILVDIDRRNGNRIRINKRKMVLKSWRSYSRLDNPNEQFTHDAFYAKYVYNDLEFLPDFWLEIPNYDNKLWNQTRTIKGQYVNGQKSGKWEAIGSKKKLLDVTFSENHPEGEFTQYKYIPPIRKRSRYWYGNQKRVPAQYYDYMNGSFKNGQLEQFSIHNVKDSVLATFVYEDGMPKQANLSKGYKASFIENGVQKETVKYVDGEHAELITTHKERGKEITYTYHFKNGYLDGEYQFEKDSGTFENALFTGKFVNNIGYDREKHEVIANGLLLKEYILNADQIKMTEVVYDTSAVKLNGSLYKIYDVSNNIPFIPLREDLSKPYSHDICGAFQSFYVNGQVHAQGELCKTTISKKEGVWTYFNPDGEKMSEAQYFPIRDTIFNGQKHAIVGELLVYENNKPSYEAIIIDLISKYNCASADNYEVRQLWVTKDLQTAETNPSRYQKLYYDMGVLQSEGEIVNGLPHGLWKFYDREGGLHSVGLYVNGKKQGRWLEGDLTGLGFIGDFCIAPDNYEFEKEALENELKIEIIQYDNGVKLYKQKLAAYLNR